MVNLLIWLAYIIFSLLVCLLKDSLNRQHNKLLRQYNEALKFWSIYWILNSYLF